MISVAARRTEAGAYCLRNTRPRDTDCAGLPALGVGGRLISQYPRPVGGISGGRLPSTAREDADRQNGNTAALRAQGMGV